MRCRKKWLASHQGVGAVGLDAVAVLAAVHSDKLLPEQAPAATRVILLTRFAHSLVQKADGTFSGHVTYGKEEAPPLARALMRVEAELLLDDARHRAGLEEVWRTPEKRRSDALVLLVLRTAVAAGSAVDPVLLERYFSRKHVRTPPGVSSCA